MTFKGPFQPQLFHDSMILYVRTGCWKMWKEAKFGVHGERVEGLLMTILFAQIFHSSRLSVYMETFCE